MEACYDSRFQFSHDNHASEENMCVPADELRIGDFHSRTLSKNDPLGKYDKLKRAAQQNKPQTAKSPYTSPPTQSRGTKRQPIGCATYVLMFLFAVLVVILITLN